MVAIRQFVAGLVAERDGSSSPELSDQDWEYLCSCVVDQGSDEAAVELIVGLASGWVVLPGTDAWATKGGQPTPTEGVVDGPAESIVSHDRPGMGGAEPETPDDWGTALFDHEELGIPAGFGQLPVMAPMPPPPHALFDHEELGIPAGFGQLPVMAPMPPPPAPPVSPSTDLVASHSETSLLHIPVDFAASPGDAFVALGYAATLSPVLVPSDLPDNMAPKPGAAQGTERRRRKHARSRVLSLQDHRRDRWASVAAWVRNIGVIILLFTAWQLWGTAITQHHDQARLGHQFASKASHAPTRAAPGFTLTPASVAIPDAPEGTVIAQLQIPKIALSQFVVSGTSSSSLKLGPGHYLGTAQPGQAGNVAIAGHRTTQGAPFNRLAELAIGDPIYVTTTAGLRLTYIVSATPVPVSPTNVTVLNNFGDDRLTLTTCHPEFSARQRLTVVAAYLRPGAAHPEVMAKNGGKPYKLGNSQSSGWNMALAPLVLLLAGLLIALGAFNRRLVAYYGREGRWVILIPVWIALLLALFEALTNFLPASV